MDPVPVKPGEVLAERYVVEQVLGSGGMGVVVSAVHRTLGERVAIKFLRSKSLAEPVTVERFLREARATARLRSEHAVRVTDVGKLETGAPYMVMEFLEGNDASFELDRRGALPVTEAIGYVLQACEALAEAHSLGIVHRDLKPANLFLTERPGGFRVVKVIDFGIAKSTESASALTTTSSTMGSPMYMSPEQIRDAKNVDARCDVWSLGVTCYELLTGGLPFHADSLHGMLASIIADPPVPLRAAAPELPVALEAALAPCFEKDRNRRYENIAELARALAPFGGEQAQEHVRKIESVLRASSSRPRVAMRTDPGSPTLVDPPEAPPRDFATLIEPPAPRRDSATVIEPVQVRHRGPDARTVAPWTQTSPPPKRRLGRVVFVGTALTCVLGAGALFVSRRHAVQGAGEAPSAISTQSIGSAARAAAPVAGSSESATTATPSPSMTATQPSAAEQSAPTAQNPPARTKRAHSKPAASASAPPAGPVTIEGRKF